MKNSADTAEVKEASESSTADGLGLMFRDLERCFTRALEERVGNFGVPVHAFRYLAVIRDKGGATPKELSDYFGVRSPTTVGSLRVLEAKGLISRAEDVNDGRKTVFRLTKRGAELEHVARVCSRDIEKMATRDLPPARLAQFREAVKIIRHSLQREIDSVRPLAR